MARVVLAAMLAVVGVAVAGPFGLVMAITPFIGVGVALLGQHDLVEPGPEAPWSELTRNLGWLLLGTVSIALVVQGGTVAVQILAGPDQQGAAGQFLNGLQIARIPLFLFQAVLASLLPKLSHQANVGRYDEFLHGLRRLVLADPRPRGGGRDRSRRARARPSSTSSSAPSRRSPVATWPCWPPRSS